MRILIGYDGSDSARAALSDLRLAGLPPDTEALVLSVVDAWLPPEGARSDEALPRLAEIRAEIRESLRLHRDLAGHAVEWLRERFAGWTLHAETCADSPAWALVKRAEGSEGGVGGQAADLVVVGPRGRNALQRMVLGSVSHKVLNNVHCSVRIARNRSLVSDEGSASPPKIVIGVDGSPDASAAVDAVAARCWPDGTQVLVAAFEQGFALGGDAAALWDFDPQASDRSRVECCAEDAAETLRRCGGLRLSIAVKPGDPKQGLLEEARAFGAGGADCIFLGAKGMRGIRRFLLGSVSTSVATNAECSVEIVHPRR